MSKRMPTEQERKDYKYLVDLNIKVTRTDNALLTKEENDMVLEMQRAAEAAIEGMMVNHGNNNSKHLGTDRVVW